MPREIVVMPKSNEYRLVRTARREAVGATVIWLMATIYSVGYCAIFGYGRTAESLTFVLGFPDWVFWGIVLPWGVCTVVASLYAFWAMTDDDLDAGVDRRRR
jgi:hypothetical protein